MKPVSAPASRRADPRPVAAGRATPTVADFSRQGLPSRRAAKLRTLLGAALAGWLALSSASPVQASDARTALIIGISRYADPAVTPLRGVEHDMASARAIARAMDIPEQGTRVVRNAQATKAGLLAALRELGERTRDGSRALIYFSGHGTRFYDPQAGGCVEGLLTYDGQVITNAELAQATQPVGQRADKLIVMLDACHSEGVLPAKAMTRGLGEALVPKFSTAASASPAACSVVANYRTRGLFAESTRLGALRENVVMITSARPDEVSFDEPERGGLATQAIRDCLLGKARDLDASGAVSLEEIRACAQSIVNERLRPFPALSPHTLTLSGNRNLVPVAVSRPAAQAEPATASPAAVAIAAANPAAGAGTPPGSGALVSSTPPASPTPERPRPTTPPLAGPASPGPPAAVAQGAPVRPTGGSSRVQEGSAGSLQEGAGPVAAPAIAQVANPAAGGGAAIERPRPVAAPTPPPVVSVTPPSSQPPAQAAHAGTAVASAPGVAAPAPAIAPGPSRPATPSAIPSVVPGPAAPAASSPATDPSPPFASLATLTDIASQADPRRAPEVSGHDRRLSIGRDTLELVVTPPRDGYLYLVLLGSDARSFYLLFPNGLDMDNRVRAGQPLRLPREDWRIRAAGPAGVNQLLVVVSDTPRALERLGRARPDAKAPFTFALNTLGGRRALFDFLTSAPTGGAESFGARLLAVEEVK